MAVASKRNYRKEYDNYHKKPVQKKNRAKRNAAKAKVGKGCSGDVGHKKSLKSGGTNAKSNLKCQSRKSNRSAGGKSGNKQGKARGGRKSK